MSAYGALPFRISLVEEIIEVGCNVSSTYREQGKLGTLKEAIEVIEAAITPRMTVQKIFQASFYLVTP